MPSYETIEISDCHGAEVISRLMGDEYYDKCGDCGRICQTKEVCAECFGDGTVSTMEPVYPDAGSPMADIGRRPCPFCTVKPEPEYEPEQ